jgi:Xaa-Pro aminopeptidase
MREHLQCRLKQAREAAARAGANTLLVTGAADMFYLSGFTGDAGVLLVEPSKVTLFTDGRFTTQAKDEAPQSRLKLVRGSLGLGVGQHLAASHRRVAYSPTQWNLASWQALHRAAGAGVRWRAAEGLVAGLRAIKTNAEVDTIREAGGIACEVMEEVIGMIRPGVAELDLAAEIGYRLRRKGASGESFEAIVAAGPRSALPHARPTSRRIGKNELVVLDLGAILRRYCSDITRTVFVGRAPTRLRRWYLAVQEAQAAARESIRSGVAAGEVDAEARRVLDKHRLGRYFVHSTGHGLGLEIHEEPRLARGQKRQLEPGMVVTIEPGVYVEGTGGIRIEDDVLVTANGSELLTRLGRDLLEL